VLEDAAVVEGGERLALTTDSFVVRPLFFPGGDIGRLAVSGTINDLVVMGAEPHYLTAGFVLEEGLDLADLERVVISMARAASEAGVCVVAGDTKVVNRHNADELFITTSGIGVLPAGRTLSVASCEPGDVVLVSGPVGDHGTAVMLAREGFGIGGDVVSDCQALDGLSAALLSAVPSTRCMRDPTRGGLATTLVEMAEASGVGIRLSEGSIPVREPVRATCELLGLDPLYVACEGRLVAVVPRPMAKAALTALIEHRQGRDAALIGEVVAQPKGVTLVTNMGGGRPLVALEGAPLPRIC